MSETASRAFIEPSGAFEHRGVRRRLLTHARYHTKAIDRFMIDPDGFCAQHGQRWLKQDRTSTVGVTSFDGMEVVVKRYNTRSPLHVVKRALRVSRAEHSWRNAHVLLNLDIPTPRPIAAVEERAGPVRRRAWYLSEYVDGQPLNEWFADRTRLQSEDTPLAEQIESYFRVMHQNYIAHGDTKATNWIVSGGTVYVIDLDAMRRFDRIPAAKKLYPNRFARDVRRFLRNFQNQPEIYSEFHKRLSAITPDQLY